MFRVFNGLAGDAVLLEAFEFVSELEDLTGEAGFVAPENIEGVGLLDPGACLGDHGFDADVVCRGSVVDQPEVEDVVFDAGETVEAEVGVDDFLHDLAFELGFGFEIGEQRGREAVVRLGFVLLKDQALAGETVFEGVHGRVRPALDTLRTLTRSASRSFGISGIRPDRFIVHGIGPVDFSADFFSHGLRFEGSS